MYFQVIAVLCISLFRGSSGKLGDKDDGEVKQSALAPSTPWIKVEGSLKSPYTNIKNNWWSCFDDANWCNVNGFMTGMYRNTQRGGSKDGIFLLEEASSANAPVDLRGASSCVIANWGASFDKKGWSVCNNGYYMRGMYRNKKSLGQGLHLIEKANCCKPNAQKGGWGTCYDLDVGRSFDNKGWSKCAIGHYMTGLWRGDCDNLYCIEKFKCCQMNGATPVPSPVKKSVLLKAVKCIKPSTGVDPFVNSLVTPLTAVAAATAGAGICFASAGSACAIIAAGAGAAINQVMKTGVANGLPAQIGSLFPGSDDDLYILMNGKKVWPSGSDYDMGSRDIAYPNIEKPGRPSICLMEKDSGWFSSDDDMGCAITDKIKPGHVSVLVQSNKEGSVYILELEVK